MQKSKSCSYKFFYGIPHAHSIYSTGRGTPINAYEYALNKGLDFLIITDHNSFLSKNINVNNKTLSKWNSTKYMCDKFNRKHDSFLSMIGFEAKSPVYGDMNIINPITFFKGNITDLRLVVLWMLNNPDSIITINHPHKNILNLKYNEILNKIITSIEVGNGAYTEKYKRHDTYYYELLDKGWKLGAINSQDNHRINFGDYDNLTVIIAKELNKENIINAFRNRTTYSTESRTLKFFFTINNYIMGNEIERNDKLRFYVFAEDSINKIKSIELVTNNNTIIKEISDINLHNVKYIYEHKPLTNETWYVIRIHQSNNRLAISSPIFLKNEIIL